jgi:hypothetical protein
MVRASSEAFGTLVVAATGTVSSTGAELDERSSVVAVVGDDAMAATVAAMVLRSDFAGASDRALTALFGDATGAVVARLRVVAAADAGRVCCAQFAAPWLVAAATGADTDAVEAPGFDEADLGRAIGAANEAPPPAAVVVPVCCLSTCTDAAMVSAAVGGRDSVRGCETGADSRASRICASL